MLMLPQIIRPREWVVPEDFSSGNGNDHTAWLIAAAFDGRPVDGLGETYTVDDDVRWFPGAQIRNMIVVDANPGRKIDFRTFHFNDEGPISAKNVLIHIEGDGKTGHLSESAAFWIAKATWADLDIGVSGKSQGLGIQIALSKNIDASLWSDSFQYVSDVEPSDDIMTVFNITQSENITFHKLISKQGGGIVDGTPVNRRNRGLALSSTRHVRCSPSLKGNFYIANSGQNIDCTGTGENFDIQLTGGVLNNAGSWALAAKGRTRHCLFDGFSISNAGLGAVVCAPNSGLPSEQASGNNIFRNFKALNTGSDGYWKSEQSRTVAAFKFSHTGGTDVMHNVFENCHSYVDDATTNRPDYGFWDETSAKQNSHSGCTSQGHTQSGFHGF